MSSAAASITDSTLYKSVPGYPFIFISEDSTAVTPEISDSLFNEIAQGIRFDVNKTHIRSNDAFIKTYEKYIAPMLRDKDLVLRKAWVRGAASP